MRSTSPESSLTAPNVSTWAMVIHGGAGAIGRHAITGEQDAAYRASLSRVAETGAAILRSEGTSLDAIEAVICLFENDPLFNAGKGAVFTADGHNELDAAIMDGATLKAGAVTGISRTRHPISLARAVMERSPHVMLTGSAAETFGALQGLEQVDPNYFFTERRWQSLIKFLTDEESPIPPRPGNVLADQEASADLVHDEEKYGTVGAVALDRHGNLAAGTSTGGITGKRWGRVGDSPIIGAGTYASNDSCAVSATGAGEYFIRLGAARDICALVERGHTTLQEAVDEVIQNRLAALGGLGGVIAVAQDGQMAWSFNTPGMYRARIAENKPLVVALCGDEP